jgi:hypothetical protein
MERDLEDVFRPHFQNHHRRYNLFPIILMLYLENLIQRERKSKPTLHLIP